MFPEVRERVVAGAAVGPLHVQAVAPVDAEVNRAGLIGIEGLRRLGVGLAVVWHRRVIVAWRQGEGGEMPAPQHLAGMHHRSVVTGQTGRP